jgi:imidazolonepropionase-like amidohydrolase
LELYLQEIRKLHAAGVRIGVGTDAGNGLTFHGNVFTEMEYLAEAALTPMEAIEAATRGNAELLRAQGETGTIEPGKRADLLLVRGDPLQNLEALRQVDRVILAGHVVEVRAILKDAIREEKRAKRSQEPSP